MANNSGLIISALQLTAPELAMGIDAQNSWKNEIIKRGARIKKYRRYERGDHDANLTPQMRDMLRLRKGDDELKEFNNNYMKIIIDKFAGRIHVGNISIGEIGDKWIEETLDRNNFDASQSMWFRGAIRDGDSYVLIDPRTLLWSSEPAYDGFSGVEALFNGQEIPWACKLWSMADVEDVASEESGNAKMILVVYQPKKISWWIGSVNGSELLPYRPKKEMTSNVMEWGYEKVPLIHFGNQIENFTSHGESELRVAMPSQDILNRTLHSMVMASEFSAFSLFWSIGIAIDLVDIQPGGVVNLTLKKDGLDVTSPSEKQLEFLKAVKVGQFSPTDISQYTQQLVHVVKEISQSTQTPIYGETITGNLSGEALKQLEAGFLTKIERFQNQNVNAVKNLIKMTADIQKIVDHEADLLVAPEIENVKIIWKDAELLDVNARIRTLQELRKNNPGLLSDAFYIRRIGSLLKMTQSEIKEEIKEAKSGRSIFGLTSLEAITGAAGNAAMV